MAFEIIDKTTFKLTSIEGGLHENWNIEAEYQDSDDYDDRLRDGFSKWAVETKADTSDIDAAKRAWYEHRLTTYVMRQPEMVFISETGIPFQLELDSYHFKDGGMHVVMTEKDLVRFKFLYVE